jgi:adenine-specific DNA-methyltransferase
MSLAQAEPRTANRQLPLFAPELMSSDLRAQDRAGEAYCVENSPADRRPHGITLTPEWLVEQMLAQYASDAFDTVIDAGAGSGRFSIAAAKHFPAARVMAVEQHPDMLQLLSQRLREEGLSRRVRVIAGDFRDVEIPRQGRCLFIGNPPYVRHHDIPAARKDWYRERMAARGIAASQLAGLHLHFLIRAADLMQPGDEMSFVTSAEWLDNGYGAAVRQLLSGGPDFALSSLWVAEPNEAVFPDALVSCAVFRAACAPGQSETEVHLGRIASQALREQRRLPQAALAQSNRWSSLCRAALPDVSVGIELGELFRITRGQVTGSNQTWILPPHQQELPAHLTVASVTRAKEIIDGSVLASDAVTGFKRVVNFPRDLDTLSDEHREMAQAFIERARLAGADQGYIARHRKPWFALDMRLPPAAFVSYMGRRPPVFSANPSRLSFVNIAHGLYPREAMAHSVLQAILDHLNTSTDIFSGRVYGGGMAKFEPSDVARLRVPASVLERASL